MPSPAPLVFVRDGRGWIGEGLAARADLPSGHAYARARQWWDRTAGRLRAEGAEGPLVAFGAFPFDPASSGGATLLVPERAVPVDGGLPVLRPGAPLPHASAVEGIMTADRYLRSVAAASAAIRAGGIEKVVLARDVLIRPSSEVDPAAVVDRLAAAHPAAAVFAVDGLIGASPETLITVHDGVVSARVLAGTAGPGEGDALLASDKDQREHALAARSVTEALAPHLRGLDFSPEPFLLELPHLTHLATDVTGRIADDSDVLALIEALHPTAAVAGTPTDAALALIRESEPVDRGRYAGPVGWMDAEGNGEWAIALRCAQQRADGSFHAFAGAGVMADSLPELELAETGLKLRPILDALGAP